MCPIKKMNEINDKIINDVKKSLESGLSDDGDQDDKKKTDKDLSSIVKKSDLDNLIEIKVKEWIKKNADQVSKKIIEEAVKKLFKG